MTERESTGEELVGDERLNPTEQQSDAERDGAAADVGETNDEPAEGAGGQESV